MVASNELLGAVAQRRPVAFSTDLVGTMSREEDGETPFTPPIQTINALREAARELLEEGVERRIVHYRDIARSLRDGLASLELGFLVSREHLSNTMTSVMMPDGFSYHDLHQPLKERGYLIYKSQGTLSETTFRLGTAGLITQDHIAGFLENFAQVLSR